MSLAGELIADHRPRPGREAGPPLAPRGPGFDGALSELPDDLSREVYCVLGVPIDDVDMAETVRRIDAAAAASVPYLISTPNLNFLTSSRTDPEFRESVIQSDLCPADGMPIVWIARMMGLPIRRRVAGSDLFDRLRKRYSPRPLRAFLFGGAAGIAHSVAQALNAKPAGLSCVGSFYPGYGNVDGMSSDEILNSINESRADFLAVALSAAKGQRWLFRNRERLRIPVRAQLGAAINFQAGTVKRAPESIQRLGLEWLWRIKEEPRLWTRYLRDGFSFLSLLATSILPLVLLQRSRRPVAPGDDALQIERLENGALRLSGWATARHIGQAIGCFREAVARSGTVVLDLAGVRSVDARFLGLLLMVRKVAAARGGRLIITRVSHHIVRLFRLNGVAFLLTPDGE